MSDIWLEGALTSAVYGWRLERGDGVTLGFTSHDRDMELDGIVYRARPGLEPSSIGENIGLETGGLEVNAALDSNAISAADLASGRWDSARLTIFLFDWTLAQAGAGTTVPQRILASGELGEIGFSDAQFRTEMRGLTSLLDGPVVPQTSPGCRAQFCDAACGLSRRRFRHEAKVQSVEDNVVEFEQALPVADEAFTYGHLRWLEGSNTGLISDIIGSTADSVTLAQAPAHDVQSGSKIAVTQGCDKTLATCSTRFDNAINFRGEPHLPGNDLLTRYPGGA